MRKFDYLYLLLIAAIIFNLFYPAELHPTTAPLIVYAIFLIYLSFRIENVFLQKKIEVTNSWLAKSVIVAVILLLTSLFGVYLSQSRDYIFIFFSYLLIFLFIKTIVLDEKKIWNGLTILVIAAGVICFYSILQYTTDFFSLSERLKDMSGISQQDRELMALRLAQKRVYAFFAFPTTLSSFLTMLIPVNIGLILKNKRIIAKFLFLIILLLQLVTLYLTKSYGGIVTLICVIILMTLYMLYRRSKLRAKHIILLILCLLFLISLSLIIENTRGGLLKLDNPANPITLRLANWKVAFNIIKDYPLLGVGLGNYGVVFPKYYTPDMQPSQFAHNSYLQTIAEIGIFPGLLLLIVLLKWFIDLSSNIQKNKNNPPSNELLYSALLAAFLSFVINNTFEINIYYPSIGFIGIYIAGLLDKSAKQCKKTDEGAVYFLSSAGKSNKIIFREKGAVGILIITWIFVTVILSLRFVGLLLYDASGNEYLSSENSSAARNVSAAIFFDPIDSRYHYLASLISFSSYTKSGDKAFINDALDSAEKAVRINPATPYLRANLSGMLFYNGRLWQSFYQLKTASMLMPGVQKYKNEVNLFKIKLITPKEEPNKK